MRWILLVVLAVCLFAAITWWQRPVVSIKRMLAPQTSTIDVILPTVDGGWKRVQRPVQPSASIPERVREMVHWLGRPDDDPSVYPALPETFPLRAVFVERNRIYLDLAQPAVAQIGGGLEDERILLAGLAYTIAGNLPSVRQMQLLVEGMPQTTLGAAGPDAGHLSMLHPFRLAPAP